MTILYKVFKPMRIVFCVFFFTFFCANITLTLPAFAMSGNLFEVDGVQVDVKAGNALEAKKLAFLQAKRDAFKTMLERMIPAEQLDMFEEPDDQLISSFVQDFEVTQEKLSSVRYIGEYTFRFDDRAVRRYFVSQGVNYTDIGSKPVLVLPFYQGSKSSVLWSQDNKWLEAWNTADNLNGVVPAMVPLGDLQDVNDVGSDDALSYDARGIENIKRRYGAGRVVLAIAKPSQALRDTNPQDTALVETVSVQLYDAHPSGPQYIDQITLQGAEDQDNDHLYERAVRDVYMVLQKNWRTRMASAPAEQNQSLKARVAFKSLKEWTRTQKALGQVYGLDNVVLRSVSPKVAYIDLFYQGSEDRLRTALQQANIVLSVPAADPAGLQAEEETPSHAGQEPRVYDLYLEDAGRTL